MPLSCSRRAARPEVAPYLDPPAALGCFCQLFRRQKLALRRETTEVSFAQFTRSGRLSPIRLERTCTRQSVPLSSSHMRKSRKKNDSASVEQKPRLAESASSRRKWLFRLTAALLIPLIFFGVLEGVLRVAGYGYRTRFFVHQTLDGQERVLENTKFGWRFFGPALARTPYPLNFAASKSSNTFRIFVFGESAAYGDPQPDFGLPRVLEVLLRERYPGVNFEVINAAMVAINSNVILPIASDSARESGDIWLVYMGNNEVVGPFGSGTVFGPQAPPLLLIRASLILKSTRTGELLSGLMSRMGGGGTDAEQWRGMMMFVQNQVRQEDPRMARTYFNFRRNLTDILRSGTCSGAKVIVSTVASNLKDCAPFGSLHSPALTGARSNEWTRLYQLGVAAQEATNATEAIRYYREAAALDDQFADLHFRWAQACLATGDSESAKEHFVMARDQDTLRFRADSRINDIIRETASNRSREGIYFLDAAQRLGEQSPGGICGEEYFYEHVHFTFEGNYALARVFAEAVAETLPEAVKRQADSQHSWASAERCASLLGWNAWSKHQVLKALQLEAPPFNFQLNHAEMLQRINHEREALARGLSTQALQEAAGEYRRLAAARPRDWVMKKKLAEVLMELGDPDAAADCWREIEQLVPRNAEAPMQLNWILLSQGKLEAAADEYVKAVKLNRSFAQGSYAKMLNEMGARVLNKGDAAAAVPFYKQALELRPEFAEARIGLGSALNALGDSGAAQEEFRAALRHPPTTPQGLTSLGTACYQSGWTNEAIRNFEAALSLDPTDSAARSCLGIALFEQQKFPAAREQFQRVLLTDPDNTTARTYLDQILTNSAVRTDGTH